MTKIDQLEVDYICIRLQVHPLKKIYPSQPNLREDISTGRPVFLLAYTILQTLISITLLNLTYSSHPVDCTIIQFKAEDRCLGKQADNYILDTSGSVSGIL